MNECNVCGIHDSALTAARHVARQPLYVDGQHAEGAHRPEGQPSRKAAGMKRVTAGQNARVVARSHHFLADDARRLVHKVTHHQRVSQLTLSQQLYCARNSLRLQPNCNKGSGCRRTQHVGVLVCSCGAAVANCAHLSCDVLGREQHSLRCRGVTLRRSKKLECCMRAAYPTPARCGSPSLG
jgi:hypothetical protein